MSPIIGLLIPSLLGLISLPLIRHRRTAAQWSACLSAIELLLSLYLLYVVYAQHRTLTAAHQWLCCDVFNVLFVLLNALVSTTTAAYAITYLNNESRLNHPLHRFTYRFYHSFFHLFSLSTLLVLLSNNLGLMWITLELATIASVVLVGLHQTKASLEAAWKYLILCGAGLALALMGTLLVYFAGYTWVDPSQPLQWSALISAAPKMSPLLLEVAFVFIFVGYGTKAGFVPLHNWLPDVYSEGPASVAALLSGILLNVAFFAIWRYVHLLDQTSAGHFAHGMLLLFGFLNLGFAALALLRQRTLKRLFAYSSIEHMGLVSIAFGIGTPLACLAGMIHLWGHSLCKSAVFFSCGNLMQRFETQVIRQLKGVITTAPLTGWLFLFSTWGVLGLPPFSLFLSELMIIFVVLHANMGLALPLVICLAIAFIAIFFKMQRMVFSNSPTSLVQDPPHHFHAYWPILLHLGLAAGLSSVFFYSHLSAEFLAH